MKANVCEKSTSRRTVPFRLCTSIPLRNDVCLLYRLLLAVYLTPNSPWRLPSGDVFFHSIHGPDDYSDVCCIAMFCVYRQSAIKFTSSVRDVDVVAVNFNFFLSQYAAGTCIIRLTPSWFQQQCSFEIFLIFFLFGYQDCDSFFSFCKFNFAKSLANI